MRRLAISLSYEDFGKSFSFHNDKGQLCEGVLVKFEITAPGQYSYEEGRISIHLTNGPYRVFEFLSGDEYIEEDEEDGLLYLEDAFLVKTKEEG